MADVRVCLPAEISHCASCGHALDLPGRMRGNFQLDIACRKAKFSGRRMVDPRACDVSARCARSRLPWLRRRRCRARRRRASGSALRSACSSVTISRAPVAPMGWPSAQAPPLTLSFSRGMPRSRCAAMATTAKASLISNRSTSLTLQPVLSSSLRIAGIGAVVNHCGSWLWVAWPLISASVGRPSRSARERRAGPAPRRRRHWPRRWPA